MGSLTANDPCYGKRVRGMRLLKNKGTGFEEASGNLLVSLPGSGAPGPVSLMLGVAGHWATSVM